jgi:peptide/histidine transporter 3/4
MLTGSQLKDIIRVLVTAVRKHNMRMEREDGMVVLLKEDDANNDGERQLLSCTKGLQCLDKATAIVIMDEDKEQEGEWSLCTMSEVEGMKILVRMLPIWVTCMLCAALAGADDHHLHPAEDGHGHAVGQAVQVPVVSLVSVEVVFMLLWVLLHDAAIILEARQLTGCPDGLTQL